MPTTFSTGDPVQTPLGKGVVREVRSNGRLVVLIGDRSVVVDATSARLLESPKKPSKQDRQVAAGTAEHNDWSNSRGVSREVDLHGFVVVEALARVDAAINAALLAGDAGLRFIHGRSGGRIRSALHRHLQGMSSVRAFRLDPTNEGVTIVRF